MTAREVLDELRRHVDRCEDLNRTTTAAISSLAQSHRDFVAMVEEPKTGLKARIDGVAQANDNSWKDFNKNAWRALGAIGLTILAAALGVAFNNMSTSRSVATQAATQAAQQVAAQQAPMKQRVP